MMVGILLNPHIFQILLDLLEEVDTSLHSGVLVADVGLLEQAADGILQVG